MSGRSLLTADSALTIANKLDAEISEGRKHTNVVVRVRGTYIGRFGIRRDSKAGHDYIPKRRSALAIGELLALKRVFGVSIQALTHRCRDLDIIGAATYRALFNEFGGLGWRLPPYEEYGAMAGELPNRFGRLCLRALAEGAIRTLTGITLPCAKRPKR